LIHLSSFLCKNNIILNSRCYSFQKLSKKVIIFGFKLFS
jgi:hypothetical protein